MSSLIKETINLLKKLRNRRLDKIRRYSSVVYDLPDWAKECLSSQMGTIKVSARESFEIFFLDLKRASPKHCFLVFSKRFAEIFEKKAKYILRDIMERRYSGNLLGQRGNNHFWQEFIPLFNVNPGNILQQIYTYMYRFEKLKEKAKKELKKIVKEKATKAKKKYISNKKARLVYAWE